jgi:hypothetical protein
LFAITHSRVALRSHWGQRKWEPVFRGQHSLDGGPVIVQVLKDALGVSVGVLDFVVSDLAPIVVQYVIAERTDVVLGFLSAGIRNNTVCRCCVNPLLQVPQAWVIAFRIAVGFESLFQNGAEERGRSSISPERSTLFSLSKFSLNFNRYRFGQWRSINGNWEKAF